MIITESQHLCAIFLILIGTFYSIRAKKLTFSGACIGALLASVLYIFSGYTGLIMLSAFFMMGTLATSWKKGKKQKTIINEGNHQQRNISQVVANAAIPALVGLLIYFYPLHTPLFQLMIAGSLASATADTLSSELGMIYGRRSFNILSFKKEAKGLDGVISIEGTLIGFAGALLIAVIYVMGYGENSGFWIIVSAGVIGNLIDSVLGAAFERRGLLTNNLVNFFNTMAAALFSGLTFYLIS